MQVIDIGRKWVKCIIIQHILQKKNYDYPDSWNLIKFTIIAIISKNGQDKSYNEAGKNLSKLATA